MLLISLNGPKKLIKNLFLKSLLLIPLIFSSGCAWLEAQEEDETANWTADRFFSEAKQSISSNDYQTGVDLLEKLQARYPFGRYSQQAQLELIYTHYKQGESDRAIAAADRFIRTHPRHPFVDYAYYLKGLTHFDRGVGLLERVFPSDPTKTDTGSARQSFNDFAELAQKFPDSRYADDARKRMLFLRNNLAGYEVNVANFYLRRQAYVAAANRAKHVLENYASSPAVVDALAVMVRAYDKLGLTELAADSARVLQTNYPESEQFAEVGAVLDGQPLSPPASDTLFGFDFF